MWNAPRTDLSQADAGVSVRECGRRARPLSLSPHVSAAAIGAATTPNEIAPPAFDPPLPEQTPGEIAIQSEGEDRIESLSHEHPDHVAPDTAKGPAGPRLGNRVRSAGTGVGPDHEGAVRPM